MELTPPLSNHRCHRCKKYEARIKELEDINDLHRRFNGELRESITELTEWIDKITKNDMEKR